MEIDDILKQEENEEITPDMFFHALDNKTRIEKQSLAKDLMTKGDNYLAEIDKKQKRQEKLKAKLIEYIIKSFPDNYDKDELNSYSYDDVQKTYSEVKELKQPLIKKFFKFLFNIN
jgi:hypothetical protein